MSKKTPALQPWQVEDAKRLDALYKNKKEKIPQDKFAPKYGLGTQGYVSQILKARRALNVDSAEKFATALGVQIEEFSPTLAAMIKKASAKVSVEQSKFSPETIKFAEKFEKLDAEGRKKFNRIYRLIQDDDGFGDDSPDDGGGDPLTPRPHHPMRRSTDRKPPDNGNGKRPGKNGNQ